MVSMIRCDIHSVSPVLSITHMLTHVLTPTLNESDDICSIRPFSHSQIMLPWQQGEMGRKRERENASDSSGS